MAEIMFLFLFTKSVFTDKIYKKDIMQYMLLNPLVNTNRIK